jgi:hypothetical protein
MWWSLGFAFLKELITGEVYRLWAEHKAREKAQAVADAPATKAELIDVLDKAKI